MNYLLGKIQCFFGFHHYHDVNEIPKVVMRLPEGLTVKARVCCRCHDLDIQDIKFVDKT